MNGFDVILLCVVITAVVVECIRGFGRAAYDALGVYAALLACEALFIPLSGMVTFHNGAADNHAAAYLALLAVIGTGFLALSHFVSKTLPFNLGMFDKFLGLGAGFALGLMLAHGIVKGASLSDPTGSGQVASYTDGAISSQVLDFPAYHSFMDTLSNATAPHRDADAR